MDCFDVIVVGSGPAATFAAYGLRGRRVLVLDVGFEPPQSAGLSGNLYKLRNQVDDLFPPLIGEHFESLHNLHSRPISLKLKAPYMTFVATRWQELSPVVSDTFEGVISLAKGGLANGWGAGVYRFTDRDLSAFPIAARELEPYYDELTAHIGISGAQDDLAPYFGRDDGLQAPLRLSNMFSELLARYRRNREYFQRRHARIGRPRLAVLTEALQDRHAYTYDNCEFFKPRNPAVYTPTYTLDRMIAAGEITYMPNRLVVAYQESGEFVDVHTRTVSDDTREVWRARTLCLGAGTLNTARIVLQSQQDYDTRLRIMDNPMVCIPFFSLKRIGEKLSAYDTSFGQLNIILEDTDRKEIIQGTVYGATGPLRSDMLAMLPLSLRANLTLMKYTMPATGLLMLFYPGADTPSSYIRLCRSGDLEVKFAPAAVRRNVERTAISLLRKVGFSTSPGLIQRLAMGQGLHFAGSLPMQPTPRHHETDAHGRLFGTRSVYIVDGACFSELPAKNLTFTIMANALRIGRLIASTLS